jgi:hypothetical protein
VKLVLATFALLLGGCGGGCNVPPTPQSDICELAPGAPRPTVTDVQIGQFDNGTFAPIAPESVVELVTGGQGSDMVVAALRITGDGLGSCTAQETVLEELDGDLITSEVAPMSTRPAGAGAVVTGDILLPYYGSYGGHVRLRAVVSGTTDAVEFWAGSQGTIDAATDAPADARTDAALVDAVVPDAMPTDAAPDA